MLFDTGKIERQMGSALEFRRAEEVLRETVDEIVQDRWLQRCQSKIAMDVERAKNHPPVRERK